ncbi:hypothetical protein Tco_0718630 [Tanacetum coccineum]
MSNTNNNNMQTQTLSALHNVIMEAEQLQKQLNKDDFQEDGSMEAFWVINRQFQMFIDSQFSLNYDSQMIDKYFAEYTRIETQESTVDFGKALDMGLVVTKSNGIESEVQDESSRSGNDTNVDDVDIRPIYEEEPMVGIFTGQRFSSSKTSTVYEKTSPKSCLRWKPMGRIFKSIGLRWIPTEKLFDPCTGKVDSEPLHGSNVDISKIHEYKETLDLSAGTSINVQKKQRIELSAGTSYNVMKENLKVWLLKRMISQKPVLQGIHN